VWCRPCFDYCIFDQAYCLRVVSVESVFETAAEALRALSPAACQAEADGNGEGLLLEPLHASRTGAVSTKD